MYAVAKGVRRGGDGLSRPIAITPASSGWARGLGRGNGGVGLGVELWVGHSHKDGIHIWRGFPADICLTLSPPVSLSGVLAGSQEISQALVGQASWDADLRAFYPSRSHTHTFSCG